MEPNKINRVNLPPDLGVTHSVNTPNPRIPEIPASSLLPSTVAPPVISCEARINLDYEITPAVICALCAVFGLLYCFLGYRFFKATMFLTGFLLAAVTTYLVCIEEHLLPLAGKLAVTVVIGLLVGLITMLVQYVGLFLTGFCLGGLLGSAGLVVMQQWYQPSTLWVCIGIIFLSGLLVALLILYFQRSLTILATSTTGSALIAVALDYFIDKLTMVTYVFACMKNAPGVGEQPVCWFSWVIMGLWPALFCLGALTQWKITGRGIDHREAVRVRRRKAVPTEKERPPRQRSSDQTHQQAAAPGPSSQLDYHDDHPHTRYRHLYQVRRSNGDVISQSYIQSIQHKLSTAVRKKVVTRRETLPPTEIDPSMASLTQTPES